MIDLLALRADLVPLALMAGVAGLDVVSFPQAMYSRPIVAATLGGAVVGAPMAGLVCGAALECLALEALPFGASRYPEWGSASVAAGAVAAHGTAGAAVPHAADLVFALLVGIGAAWIGGWTMVRHRQIIGWMVNRKREQLAEGNPRTVVGLHLFGLGADLLRGVLLGATALIIGRLVAQAAQDVWSLPSNITLGFVVTSFAAVAAAAVWKNFHAISGTRRLFLAALAVGTAVVMLRG